MIDIPLLSGQVCWGLTIDCNDAFTCNIWVNEQLCYKSIPLYICTRCIFYHCHCNMGKNYFAIVVLITMIVLRNDTKSIKSVPIHTFYLESNAYSRISGT